MSALETTGNVSHAHLVRLPINNTEFGDGPIVLVRQCLVWILLRAAPKSKAVLVRLTSWEVILGSQEWGPREVKCRWTRRQKQYEGMLWSWSSLLETVTQTHRASCDKSQNCLPWGQKGETVTFWLPPPLAKSDLMEVDSCLSLSSPKAGKGCSSSRFGRKAQETQVSGGEWDGWK